MEPWQIEEARIMEAGRKADRHLKLRTLEELYKVRFVNAELWRLLNEIWGFSRSRFNNTHYGYIHEMQEITNKWINDLEKEFGIDD